MGFYVWHVGSFCHQTGSSELDDAPRDTGSESGAQEHNLQVNHVWVFPTLVC